MKTQLLEFLLGCLTAAGLLALPTSAGAGEWCPDRIVHNGQVYRGQGAWAEGFATTGRFFTAVGTSAEVLELAGACPDAELLDAGGRLVIPGLNDAHIHLFPGTTHGIPINNPTDFMPGPGPDKAQMLAMLAGAAAQLPPGTWLWGFMGNALLDDGLADEGFEITRWEIDAVTPNHPVVLWGYSGHGMVFDSQAMVVAGIGETEPDPWGGWYGREGDLFDGWAWEYAEYRAIRNVRDTIPPEALAPQFNAGLLSLAKLGVTSVQSMDFLDEQLLGTKLEEAGPLTRVRIICVPMDYQESVERCQPEFPDPLAKVHFTGIKWIPDGTPIERLSAMVDDYDDAPGWPGVFTIPEGDWPSIVADGLEHPIVAQQRIIHAIGEETIDRYVSTMEAIAPDARWRRHRMRLEHGEFASRYADRLAAKGVVTIYNPTHHSFPELLYSRWGGRASEIHRMRTLLDAGADIALGSDGIAIQNPFTGEVIAGNPFLDIFLAVVNPTNPTEGLTVQEAVDAYTHGSAYAEFMELYKGTIEVGKLADYAILSQNIFDPQVLPAIPATYSVRTVCDGEDVYVLGP